MVSISCASKGLKGLLSELAPNDSEIVKELPECLGDKSISFRKEEKKKGAITTITDTITKPIGEFVSPVTKPISRFIAPVTKPVAEVTGAIITPMIEPTKSLAKRVGLGVLVSLIVITIVGFLKKKQ